MLNTARSLLFVPGHRADRFAKATASGADVVCIDLEDAVPPGERPAARLACLQFLAAQPAGHRCGVRISRLAAPDGLRDVLALADAGAKPAYVMLAKSESAEELRLLAAHLPGLPLIALIESARGLAAAMAIASAHAQVQALMLGGVDLAAELGCEVAWEPLLFARSTLVTAAAASAIACIDVPWLDVADAEGAREETARIAALGFSGKSMIHPSQVASVHAGFAPAPEALERARRVVAAAGVNDAAVLVDGRMVDRPVVLAAQRLLRRAAGA